MATSSSLRAYILIFKLTMLAALSLLPLLAWHNAMTHLSDKYDMPRMWEEDFRQSQFSRSKVWVWVFMWIFIPLDILHALLCLAWYHEILYPLRRQVKEVAREDEKKQPDSIYGGTKGPTKQGTPTDGRRRYALASMTSSKFATFARSCHGAQARMLQIKKHFAPLHSETPLTYHPLLHAIHPPLGRFLLLASYDTLLVTVLVLHIYTYIISIRPSMAFCYTGAVYYHANSAFEPLRNIIAAKDVDFPFLNMKERCERLNWNIHIAGGFACALAALLATMHIGAFMYRLYEELCMVLEPKRRKQRTKCSEVQLEHMEPNWLNAPRDVDIQARNTGRDDGQPKSTGRLTGVSEEEISTGGMVTRRKQASKSQSGKSEMSKSSSGDSGRLEHVLLECLVP